MRVSAVVSEIRIDLENTKDLLELHILANEFNGVVPLKFAITDVNGVGIVSGDEFVVEDYKKAPLCKLGRYLLFRHLPNASKIALELSGEVLVSGLHAQKRQLLTLDSIVELEIS